MQRRILRKTLKGAGPCSMHPDVKRQHERREGSGEGQLCRQIEVSKGKDSAKVASPTPKKKAG